MIERPQKIVCVGLNYRDHAEEQGVELPERPLLFAKWPNTLIASGEPIRVPSICKHPDYEAELGVVIGRRASGVAKDDALDPQALPIRAILNGETMQDSNTSNQIFGVAEVVSFVSQAITLETGDLIITGTPAGVGAFRDPRSEERRVGIE